ncbi:hypothetical protein KDD17_05060 [Sulfitobacter albidus]|uniref:Calcium-binding protein n=1 Tax=Sulfitobacter albidus TaxID=2829501 RepID=A0A975JF51_9RHOB|nr:calcium-binding protein [Sulfitobacter albidus]QUJ77369.1 hypothetical protein KDD17_05060 [Sulfitobacter albidus]
MPFFFNSTTNQHEGAVAIGETVGAYDFDVFGGLITNEGTVAGPITALTDANITLTSTEGALISKAPGSKYALDLQGNGARFVINDGEIFGEVRFGNGWDTLSNTGTMTGRVDLGGGNDLVLNQSIPGSDGVQSAGLINGGLFTGAGNDTVLNSGTLRDVFLGDGADTYSASFGGITGKGIAASVRGGTGNDTMTGGNDADQLFGNDGDDRINGGGGNDKIGGGTGNDLIWGGARNDRIGAGAGDDTIDGGTGNDQIWGAGGADLIDGGRGNDRLEGGSGADTFVFGLRSGRDTITDFGLGDRIEIVQQVADAATFADILAHATEINESTTIDLGGLFNDLGFASLNTGTSRITLQGVEISELDSFMFNIDDVFAVG